MPLLQQFPPELKKSPLYLPRPGVRSGNLASHNSPLNTVILQVPGLGLQLGQHCAKQSQASDTSRICVQKVEREEESESSYRGLRERSTLETWACLQSPETFCTRDFWPLLFYSPGALSADSVCELFHNSTCPPGPVSQLSPRWAQGGIHTWNSWLCNFIHFFFSTTCVCHCSQIWDCPTLQFLFILIQH